MGSATLKRWADDRRGIAAVEFALIAPLFLLALGVCIDCALAYRAKLRLVSAVTAASQFVAQKGSKQTAGSIETFLEDARSVVVTVAGHALPAAATVLVNNAPSSINFDQYYCVEGASPETWTWSSTGKSKGPCNGGTQSGKYVTIVSTASVATYVVPASTSRRLSNVRDFAIIAID